MHGNSSRTAFALTEDELLEQYLSSPRKLREERFISTALAAEIAGLSVRTIQFWIEIGFVQAIAVGRKYRVEVNSLRQHLREQNEKRPSQQGKNSRRNIAS